MLLDEALEILRKKCPDYYRYNADIVRSMELDPSKVDLRIYLEQIKNDPLEWINLIPKDAASYGAMAKPKSGVLFLVEKVESVKEAVGQELCNGVSEKLTEVWREHGKKIGNARKESKEQEMMKESKEPKIQLIRDGCDGENLTVESSEEGESHADYGASMSVMEQIRELTELNVSLTRAAQEAGARTARLEEELLETKRKLEATKGLVKSILDVIKQNGLMTMDTTDLLVSYLFPFV